MAYQRTIKRAEPDCCSTGRPECCQYGAVSLYGGTTSLRGDDDAGAKGIVAMATSPAAKTAAAVAMTYHGYKRTGSILWALLYGLAGKTVPLIAVPVAAAQGFGKPKPGCP